MNTFPALKPLPLALALGFCLPLAAWAQSTSEKDSSPQRVVVTGSNVKRIDAETAAPLQILNRQDILNSGAITVKDVLELSTSNDRNGISDLAGSNAWASGASGVSLRDLGMGSTLVLLNGRRLPSYGFADGLQTTFVNIDAIPASAVERVEILRDGASAIYGSAAIGGVINIITRQDFQGVSVNVSAQQGLNNHAFDNHKFANLSAGMGDLDKNGYNAFFTLDAYRRGSYTDDFVNQRLPAWYLTLVPTRNPAKTDSLSTGAMPGNYTGYYPDDYPDPARAGKRISQPMPGCAPDKLIGGLCRYNYWQNSDAMPGADRVSMYGMLNVKFSDTLSGWLEAQLSSTESTYHTAVPRSNYTGDALTWYDSKKGTLQYFTDPALPVGHPANPFSFPVGLNYRFADDPDMFKNVGGSQQYRFVGGLKGQLAGWEWDSAFGTMGSRAHQRQQYYRDRYAYTDAILSGAYHFGQSNPRSLLDKMFPVMGSDGKSTETFLDFKASRDLFSLAGGPMTLVLGGDARHETFLHKSMDNILDARIVQFSGVDIQGSRNVLAAFAEVNAPLTQKLEADFALRADKSGPTALELIPKANASYRVNDAIKLRGTLSRGYRAPGLPETGNGGASWFATADDPKRCAMAAKVYDALMLGDATDQANAVTAWYSGCGAGFPSTVAPNSKLEPERSTIYSLGLVLQPTRSTSITLDYWSVKRNNEITVRGADYILAHEDQNPGLVTRAPLSRQDQEFAQRASQLSGSTLAFTSGVIQGLRDQYENVSKSEISGLDLSVKTQWNLGAYGRLTTGLESTLHLNSRWYDLNKETMSENYIGYRGNPRVNANLTANWTQNAWNAGGRLSYLSGRKLAWGADDTTDYLGRSCAKLGIAEPQCRIGDDYVLDVYASYAGFANTRLGLNVFNLFNRPLPDQYRTDGPLPIRGRSLKLWGEYRF